MRVLSWRVKINCRFVDLCKIYVLFLALRGATLATPMPPTDLILIPWAERDPSILLTGTRFRSHNSRAAPRSYATDPQIAPGPPKIAPGSPQDPPKTPQDPPKRPPRSAQDPPRTPKTPRRPSRSPQEPSQGPPKTLPRPPTSPQDPPKTAPRPSKINEKRNTVVKN